MDNLPVIIQIVSLLITIAAQVCMMLFFWGKFSERVDNLKEDREKDRQDIMTGIKDMGRSMYNLTSTVNEHGKKIQALETWRDIITPNVHAKRNGSNG